MVSIPGDYNLISVLKAHILMCKRRNRTYTDLIEELHENEKLAEVCGFAPDPDSYKNNYQ